MSSFRYQCITSTFIPSAGFLSYLPINENNRSLATKVPETIATRGPQSSLKRRFINLHRKLQSRQLPRQFAKRHSSIPNKSRSVEKPTVRILEEPRSPRRHLITRAVDCDNHPRRAAAKRMSPSKPSPIPNSSTEQQQSKR